ncbi:hypothetical protein EOD39_15916 [Acipenser ruthenus]|uniref:Uncharacterized protein n=1 Tax=Acipenser ruthenus TaxID=7906 RepID=A0A444V737_ACIRT|nr:hypothetical protein EOD39_15916 [Acipenser ruthenus]
MLANLTGDSCHNTMLANLTGKIIRNRWLCSSRREALLPPSGSSRDRFPALSKRR